MCFFRENFLAINAEARYISFRFGGFLTAHFFLFVHMSELKPASKKNPIINYFQESYEELKKVTWPTRNQAIRLTFIVIGFCIVFSILVGALDLAFNTGYVYLVDLSGKIAPVSTTTPVAGQVATGEPTSKVDLSKLKIPAETTVTDSSTSTPNGSTQQK